jgi:hypothetical protein
MAKLTNNYEADGERAHQFTLDEAEVSLVTHPGADGSIVSRTTGTSPSPATGAAASFGWTGASLAHRGAASADEDGAMPPPRVGSDEPRVVLCVPAGARPRVARSAGRFNHTGLRACWLGRDVDGTLAAYSYRRRKRGDRPR